MLKGGGNLGNRANPETALREGPRTNAKGVAAGLRLTSLTNLTESHRVRLREMLQGLHFIRVSLIGCATHPPKKISPPEGGARAARQGTA